MIQRVYKLKLIRENDSLFWRINLYVARINV